MGYMGQNRIVKGFQKYIDFGRFIQTVPKLLEQRYKGDYEAVDILLDLDRAFYLANLTYRQKLAIFMVDILGYRLNETAVFLGVDVSTLSRTRKAGLLKVATIYFDWKYLR